MFLFIPNFEVGQAKGMKLPHIILYQVRSYSIWTDCLKTTCQIL